jgi:lambda family phage portal protein
LSGRTGRSGRNFFRELRATAARIIAPELTRGFDAASWKRFPKEARFARTATETLASAPAIRSRARYYYANDAHAHAAVESLVAFAVGAGPVPAHPDAELVADFMTWWDAAGENGADFGSVIASLFREAVVSGDGFAIARHTPEGDLYYQLIPAEQVAESESRELGGGAFIASGVEHDATGRIVAYWIHPRSPTTTFESYAPPVRVDARDVIHLAKLSVGQIRGVSFLAPVLLRLADLGLLSDSLLKGFQVAALHAGFIEDSLGTSGLPFDGQATDNPGELEVSLEPGTVRRLGPGQKITFNNPQAANQSIEFLTANIEAISAGLGVPAFLVSGNCARANFSSLRASVSIAFKARLEALQWTMIAPMALAPIWRRFVLTRALRDGRAVADADMRCEWRFPALPEPDPAKSAAATITQLDARLMSRREAIAARGESIERVDADIAADPFTNDPEPSEEDSNDDA